MPGSAAQHLLNNRQQKPEELTHVCFDDIQYSKKIMIRKIVTFLFIFMCVDFLFSESLTDQFKRAQKNEINYFDQQPPGLSPKRFAPGLISTEKYSELGCAFSPEGTEFYFTRSGGDLFSPAVFVSLFQNSKWTRPEKAPLEGFGLHISPDGTKMFVSKRESGREREGTVGLWFATKEENRWTALQYHGLGSRPSISRSHNLYYIDRSNKDDRGVIVVQRFVEGKYVEPEILGGGVNTLYYEAHPCIAEDEAYIIFDSNRPSGYGEGDLYVCFRKENGFWGKAYNLGPAINTKGYEAYASISPDGKYLFYSSNKAGNFDLYWVNLSIIESVAR